MNFIDAIIYINLDRRPDRREHIELELAKIDSLDANKVFRFSAIDQQNAGCVGCLKSHLSVLQLAKEKKYENVLILEDDFTFIGDANENIMKLKAFWDEHQNDFGFVQLTSNCNIQPIENISVYPHPSIITTNAAGYFVHARCYDLLIRELEKSVFPLESTGQHWIYMNDVVWNNIRNQIPTYIFVPRIGHQYANFSDLSCKNNPLQ